MHRTSPVTQVVAIGIGAALFFVLARFVAIPSPIPNTAIALQYAVLAVFAVLYGPIVGVFAGLIGHVLTDATGYSLWFSWEAATAVVGLVVGLLLLRNRIHEGEFGTSTIVRFNLAVVLGHAIAWLLVAPTGDVLIYAEPASKVFAQGVFAFAANSVLTCILGTLILAVYAKTRTKTGSLTLDQ